MVRAPIGFKHLDIFATCSARFRTFVTDRAFRIKFASNERENSLEGDFSVKLLTVTRTARLPALYLGCLALIGILAFPVNDARADALTQAKRMHMRIAGVPALDSAVINSMTAEIQNGNPEAAAMLAMESPFFYNVTLKNMWKPITNRDDQVQVPLNDMVATIVGVVRDDVSFDQVLYGDIIYTASDQVIIDESLNNYSNENNTHYEQIEARVLDLSDVLVSRQQSALTGINDTAGVLTSRAFAANFLEAGTNRAGVRFSLMGFLCNDLENLSDTSVPDFHVRRDVDRSPGGDSNTYTTTCKGCHAGMDSLASAFNYMDFNGRELVESTEPVDKVNRDPKFAGGWVSTDNTWTNLWAVFSTQNARIGWQGAGSGQGVRSYGQMLSQTGEFSRCIAKRTFKQICMRDAVLD